jgi:hypothetical protein
MPSGVISQHRVRSILTISIYAQVIHRNSQEFAGMIARREKPNDEAAGGSFPL